MEAEERRIWAKVRCWGSLSFEHAAFLKRLDALRGYVRMPDGMQVMARCWTCDGLLSAAEMDQWWCRFSAGLINYGPYCARHTGQRRG